MLTAQQNPATIGARGEKLRQFIDVCLRERLTEYLELVLDVGLTTDPAAVWRKFLEVSEMRMVLPEETYRDIDEFLRKAPEVREKLTWVQQIVRESTEEGEQRGEQRTLVRQMRRKFGDVPEKVVRRVQATRDSNQLSAWLDRVVEAGSLAEMGFDQPGEGAAGAPAA